MIEGYYDKMRRLEREAQERAQQQQSSQTIQHTTTQPRQQIHQQTLQHTTTQPRQQAIQQQSQHTHQQTIQQTNQQTHQQTIQQTNQQTHQQQSQHTHQQTTTANKKSHRFQMRMTTQQHNKVKHLKSAWKLKTESAVIDRLIETVDETQSTQSALAQNVQELTKIRAELNKIGVNINQIAKSANSNALTQRDIQYLYNLCSQMNKIIYERKDVK
mgnify:CR=1 FL=1